MMSLAVIFFRVIFVPVFSSLQIVIFCPTFRFSFGDTIRGFHLLPVLKDLVTTFFISALRHARFNVNLFFARQPRF